jgi:tetratricopeptide (TPR) repeat protein
MWLRAFFKLFHVFFGMIIYGEKFDNVKIVYYMEQARYFGSRGAVEKAVHYCNKALELDTENFYALAGLATASVQKQEFHLALEYANKAVPKTSRDLLERRLSRSWRSLLKCWERVVPLRQL